MTAWQIRCNIRSCRDLSPSFCLAVACLVLSATRQALLLQAFISASPSDIGKQAGCRSTQPLFLILVKRLFFSLFFAVSSASSEQTAL